ncbi:MAG: hypothetical protein KAQ62_16255, partial [Cyclobacteriaceae bacterium]|nr:hypothetical protein [Cyclobacteriaceae bacterium]
NAFVSCDMTGSFVTYDGGEKWRMFNLRGVTKFYSFDRNEPNVVYAGTSNMLFKSTDKGTSWATIYPKPSDIVAIHAQGDHANEVVVTKDSTVTVVEKMAVDPENSQRLFLLVRKRKIDIWPPSRGKNSRFYMAIMVSEDGGDNWKLQDKLPFDQNNIFIDPTSPIDNRTIYISGKDGLGVKKNGNWSNISLPEGVGSITQFVDGMDTTTNQHIIYAISGQSYFNPNGNKNDSRIYMTNNGGQNWNRIDKSLQKFKIEGADDPEFRSIATSYHHPETIYVSYAKLKISKDSVSIGVAKSVDYGKTWALVWKDVDNTPSHNRRSGWLDERFGPGWGENPFHMAIDERNPEICYATDFGRTIKTIDGGLTWQQIYTNKNEGGGWISRGLQVTTGYMLAFDPFDSLHVFMADTDTGLMESRDGGHSWTSATHNNGVPRRWVNSTYWLLFDPEVKDKVWAVMSANHDLPRPKMWRNINMSEYRGGVLVSDNGGKTWKPKSNEIGEFAPTHIIIDKKSDSKKRTLYVCAFGEGVYKSIDDGNSWQQKNNGIEGVQPAAWRLTQKNNGDLFLIISRKSDDGSIGNENDGALYKSADGAETWKRMNLPDGVNGPTSLIVDPNDPNRLLLSTWGRYGKTEFSANRGGGIYLSENDGMTWTAVLTKDQHIHDLTVDQQNGVFYASGFNSSAYRSEDRGKSWKRIKGYNFKWGKRVQPDPNDPEKVYVITFGGGVWYGPAKGDEKALEDIVTAQTSYK